MTLANFNEVMKYIEKITDDKSLVIVGQTFDDYLEDKIKVTIIATGFEQKDANEESISDNENSELADENVISYPDFMKLLQTNRIDVSKAKLEEPAFMRSIKSKHIPENPDSKYLTKKTKDD